MSGCSLLERISTINMEGAYGKNTSPPRLNHALPPPNINPVGPGPGGGGGVLTMPPPPPPPLGPVDKSLQNGIIHGMENLMGELCVGPLPHGHPPPPPPLTMQQQGPPPPQVQAVLEKDYYGCYCLKFIVKNGSHITEEKVVEDFGHFGEVVDVRGPGLFSGLRGNHVYVRFIDKADAEDALRQLSAKYHQLTPASISDVLPDNYGLYTISFYNKTGIPSAEVRKEFSQFGEVKNLTGSLDVKGGRVFVSYKDKTSAVQALQAFFFRKERYPNMKFALPRCEKDYFGCYCLKFYNKSGDVTEEKVNADFGQFGEVVDVRGPGLFDVTGDDVYVRYKEKTSAEQALIELVGKYDSLCLAPPSDIQADKFGYFTITFVNDKCLSKSDVWYIFSKFGTVACVNGTFDCKKGRVFVSYKDKQGALNALETMLITKEYHLQVSKNSTVRKNDYNVVGGNGGKDSMESSDFNEFGGLVQPNTNGVINNVTRNNSDGAINGKTIMPGTLSSMVAASMQQHQQQHHFLKDATAGMQLAAAAAAAAAVQQQHQQQASHHHVPREHSRSRESSMVPPPQPQPSVHHTLPRGPSSAQAGISTAAMNAAVAAASSSLAASSAAAAGAVAAATASAAVAPPNATPLGAAVPPPPHAGALPMAGNHVHDHHQQNRGNGLVKFNRNVGKDIFGYYCLSFLNEDGDINEKKVRHDFGKFGEVVSVRGALGKQKGHVFVRFRRKESAENCLNCLNSFPLSEMSELFGKYLFLSPATPRDIDCDMYGFYSISFLNLNMNTFHEIRGEFSKFGEIVRLTSGGGGNTDELVSISYKDKSAAVKALQTHFTNKEFPYLDIAKGSSLLLVTSSDSSDNEEGGNEGETGLRHRNHHHHHLQHHRQHRDHRQHHHAMQKMDGASESSQDPFHDPVSSSRQNGHAGSSDIVDELLKPLQSYFNTYRTGQFASLLGGDNGADGVIGGGGGGLGPLINGAGGDGAQQPHHQRSPDKKYRIKSVKGQSMPSPNSVKSSSAAEMRRGAPAHAHPPPPLYLPPPTHGAFAVPPPPPPQQPQQPQQLPTQATADAVATAAAPVASTVSASAPAPSTNEAPVATQSPPPSPPEFSEQQREQRPLSPPASPQESGSAVMAGPSSTSPPLSPNCEPGLVVSDVATKAESNPIDSESQPEVCNGDVNDASMTLPETAAGDVDSPAEVEEAAPQPTIEEDVVREDYLGYFSLSFSNRCKDLSERKIRLDISKESGVSPVRVRGLAGLSKSEVGSGEVVTVSFSDKESAEKAMSTSKAKYPGLRFAPKSTLRPDKDGFFSVEFINCGMSGIREITNEFSKHGEVSKVMAGGGSKNAVKRVTVSFAEKEPALAAVRAHSNSKDFASLDFAKENVFEAVETDACAEKTSGNSEL